MAELLSTVVTHGRASGAEKGEDHRMATLVAHAILVFLVILLTRGTSECRGTREASRFLGSVAAVAMSPWALCVVAGFWCGWR